jgi:hypothetical protein
VVKGSAHAQSIACASWWGLLKGRGPDRFEPQAQVTRAQAASTVAAVLQAAGVPYAPSGKDHFRDDEGTVHEQRLDWLADLGLLRGAGSGLVRPDERLTRAQTASLLVAAWEHVSGPLPTAPDAFRDDDGSTHERNVDKAVAAGLVRGLSATRFAPDGTVLREQLASFVVNKVDGWCATGAPRRRPRGRRGRPGRWTGRSVTGRARPPLVRGPGPSSCAGRG